MRSGRYWGFLGAYVLGWIIYACAKSVIIWAQDPDPGASSYVEEVDGIPMEVNIFALIKPEESAKGNVKILAIGLVGIFFLDWCGKITVTLS